MAPKPRKPAAGAPASPALARARPAAAAAPAAPQPQAAAPEPEAQPAPSPPAAVAAGPQPTTTPAPEPEAQPQPEGTPAAEGKPKRKGKSKGKRWKPPGPFTPPPVALPGSADELLALELPEVERLQVACELRMGHLKAKRARWLKDAEPPAQKLAELAAEVAELSSVVGALSRRRTALRVASRKAYGKIPERADAIALAADRVLWPGPHRTLMAEADRIQARAAKDLAADDEPPTMAP